MTEQVFPQNGDFNDGENFGFMIGQSNLLDYVEDGMDFTYNNGGPSVDIGSGKAFIEIGSATGTQSGKTISIIGYAIQKDAVTGIPLTNNDVNYIWLTANEGTDDAADYDVTTTNAPPTSGSIKIGEINTTTDEVTEINRGQSPTYTNADIEDTLTLSGGAVDLTQAGADTVVTLKSGRKLVIEASNGVDKHEFSDNGNLDISGSLTEGSSL